MSNEPNQLTGPDLGAGVALNSLIESRPLLGHVAGEPVMLVRCEGKTYAVSARCTHYGGPLDEGLITGCMVRCPWHHAAFDLRTGEAVRAPALNRLPTYPVSVQGGQIVVGRKQEEGPLEPVAGTDPPVGPPASVVIVGAGAAGSSAAEMLRRLGYRGSLIIVDPVESEPVDRPNLSKDYLAGTASEDWIPLRPPGFYPEHGIERIQGEVVQVNPESRLVMLAGGRALPYERLLLATGSAPTRLDIPGADLPHVRELRTLDDSRKISALAAEATSVVVIGSSFIGMETAAALRTRGLRIHVVSHDRIPFSKTLGPELGQVIQARFQAKGVTFHLSRTPTGITSTHVHLDDGSTIRADLIVVGIGVRPRVVLAGGAGLQMENGIVVNEYLETSRPGIFAAGDIAAWPDPHTGRRIRVEHWVVAQRQGQTAARNMLGQRQVFDAIPFFWTRFLGMDLGINYTGHALQGDRSITRFGPGDQSVTSFQDGQHVHAVATIMNDTASLLAEA
ncbi:MAG: FAD-dependent oxidoreductase, partial [Gemmatimonadota bacterium]